MALYCHNCLSDLNTLTQDNQLISWRYIERLHQLQEEEGLHLANKLSARNVVDWRKHKMKVLLATQTLSCSVADAMDFLAQIGDEDFQGSKATVAFIRTVDRVFDVFNSRWEAKIFYNMGQMSFN